MKILIVSIPLELPLSAYCLASHLADTFSTDNIAIKMLTLDTPRLNNYNQKNSEIWRYIAHIENDPPEIITFSIYLWNVLVTRELIAITKKLYPEIKIIIGGPEVATKQTIDQFMAEDGITAAVIGEGEETLVEIVKAIYTNGTPEKVEGCSWYDGALVHHENARKKKHKLNYKSPYLTGWIKKEMFDRFEDGKFIKGRYSRALLETFRGCYMKCSYCQWGNNSVSRAKFPIQKAKDELTWLISNGIARIFIIDSMFGFNIKTAKEILHHIIKEKNANGVNTYITCYHNQDFFDEELFELYHKACVTAEVDIQSTNENVLEKLGRKKWGVENYLRHVNAFRQHNVSTTGAADLIIGLPGDNLSSFEDSAGFLLNCGINVGIYHTSIIPGSSMAQTVKEDEVKCSSIPPRPVFCNSTFPVKEMITARLMGHGIDFIIRYPQTAKAVQFINTESPVEFCKRFGKAIWEKYDLMYGETWQYSSRLAGMRKEIETTLAGMCNSERMTKILIDLFRLEFALAESKFPETGDSIPPVQPVPALFFHKQDWTKESPRFQHEYIKQIPINYRVDHLYELIKRNEYQTLQNGDIQKVSAVILVYLGNKGEAEYQIIDKDITWQLLERFNGFFTVEECLDKLMGDNWRGQSITSLTNTLTALANAGLIVPGEWARNQDYLKMIKHDICTH